MDTIERITDIAELLYLIKENEENNDFYLKRLQDISSRYDNKIIKI